MTERENVKSDVLGVVFDALTMDQVVGLVTQAIEDRQRLRIGVVNAAKLINMGNDPGLDADVRSSDVVLADGMSIVWASSLAGQPLPERVAGIDLMFDILNKCSQLNGRVFLLGATEEVCQEVIQRIHDDYPGVVLAGHRNGYFQPDDEQEIVSQINLARADVLFVAITSPIKERFMARWGGKLTATVIHGVGGSFDVYAGKVKRAPVWMQKFGLEWFYRVLQEPSRMWRRYLVTNVRFMGKLISYVTRTRFKRLIGRAT